MSNVMKKCVQKRNRKIGVCVFDLEVITLVCGLVPQHPSRKNRIKG